MNGWKAVTYTQICEKAKLFNANARFAVGCRIKFLKARLHENAMEYATLVDWMLEGDDLVLLHIWNKRAEKHWKAIQAYKQQIASLRAQERGIENDGVTPEMIEQARKFPMELVIEFIRGKVRCISPDHDDKHPSAYYASRTNRLICPVCDKSWDTIAVYQHIHEVDFPAAVRRLR